MRTSDSPLLEEITSHRFPKKFVKSRFEYYSGRPIPSSTSSSTRTRRRSTLTITYLESCIPIHFQRRCVRLVLLSLKAFTLEFQRGEVGFLPPVCLPTRAKEEQQSPPHNQDEARREPQVFRQLFSKPNGLGL